MNERGGGNPSLSQRELMQILLAVATFDGKVTTQCCQSILKNTHILRDSGHKVTPFFNSGNVYIARARNICVHYFLASDCTDLIFVDADVAFDDDAMLKLLKHDKDIVAGIYPLKQEKLEFPMTLKFDEVTQNCKEEETGLVMATMVPTGFLRIQRRVFEKMIAHYPMEKDHEEIYSFFDTGQIFPNDNSWYGEDTTFCKRWIAMGGELFIEPTINFTHTGVHHYKGNMHDYLMGRKVRLDYNTEGLKGWTSEKELGALSVLALRSKDVVEIGSWKGRSTKTLLESCKGTVYAVDHWNGTTTDISGDLAKAEDVFKEFMENVGSYQNLKIIKSSSVTAAESFNGKKVDMVFIDAGHTYEECKEDIEAWLPKCTKFISGHDYSYDSVKRAVDEKFQNVNVMDQLW